MSRETGFLAVDLGASSGRVMMGRVRGGRIRLAEVHRFPNGPVRIPDPGGRGQRLHWDVLRIWEEIKTGLGLAIEEHGADLVSIGVDTWGVDFALLDRMGGMLSNPYHYRDDRTEGMMEEAFRRVGRREIYERTGIQFLPLNTVYQLLALVVADGPILEAAETLLTMPDLFNYWLTGRQAGEFTNVTTTQCYDPREGDWAWPLLERLGIPTHVFPEIIPSATCLGDLLPAVAEEVGTTGLSVIAPACHDTGSAVAAVPAAGSRFAYISSGTWSLMGAELPAPEISPEALACGFTNEGGVEGTFRFLKNIAGLWLLEECRRTWARQGETLSYDTLTQMAAEADPLVSLIDVDGPDFAKPGDMPERIRRHCWKMGQPVPQSKGAVVRCVLESLALKYRWVLDKLEEVLGYRLEPVHIVGGGSQNGLLNQLAADACQRPVIAGPVEATATGNVVTQAMALGRIGSVKEGRQIVRDSFDLVSYEPADGGPWDEAYQRWMATSEGP